MISLDNLNIINKIKPTDQVYIHYDKSNQYLKAVLANMKVVRISNNSSKQISHPIISIRR